MATEKQSAFANNSAPALTDAVVSVKAPAGTPSNALVTFANALALIFSNNSVGAAVTYTPTLGGITLGTGGTISAEYRQIGKMVWCQGQVILGTSGAFTGATNISLPVAGNVLYGSTWGGFFYGRCAMVSSGGVIVPGDCRANDANDMFLSVDNVAGTYPAATVVTTGVPFTWNASCQFSWNLFYEAA